MLPSVVLSTPTSRGKPGRTEGARFCRLSRKAGPPDVACETAGNSHTAQCCRRCTGARAAWSRRKAPPDPVSTSRICWSYSRRITRSTRCSLREPCCRGYRGEVTTGDAAVRAMREDTSDPGAHRHPHARHGRDRGNQGDSCGGDRAGLSAHADRRTTATRLKPANACREAGMDGLLTKPVDPHLLTMLKPSSRPAHNPSPHDRSEAGAQRHPFAVYLEAAHARDAGAGFSSGSLTCSSATPSVTGQATRERRSPPSALSGWHRHSPGPGAAGRPLGRAGARCSVVGAAGWCWRNCSWPGLGRDGYDGATPTARPAWRLRVSGGLRSPTQDIVINAWRIDSRKRRRAGSSFLGLSARPSPGGCLVTDAWDTSCRPALGLALSYTAGGGLMAIGMIAYLAAAEPGDGASKSIPVARPLTVGPARANLARALSLSWRYSLSWLGVLIFMLTFVGAALIISGSRKQALGLQWLALRLLTVLNTRSLASNEIAESPMQTVS